MVVGLAVALIIGAPAPLAFELQAPEGGPWAGRAAEATRVAARTLGARTRLAIRSGRKLGMSAQALKVCRSQVTLVCWVDALVRMKDDPFAKPLARSPSDFVLVRLAPLPESRRALVLAWIVDLEAARRGFERPGARSPRGLRQHTVRRRFEIEWSERELERVFATLWDDRAPRFRAAGQWWPNGEIIVRTGWMPPFEVEIDGRATQTATASTVVLRSVAAGRRRLSVMSGASRVSLTVGVDAGRAASVDIEAPTAASTRDDRTPLLWSGVGLAAVGAAVAVAGLAADVKSELVQVCAQSASCDEPARFARVSDYFSARTTPDGGEGPLVVPLGYSLAITGTAWALSAALWDDPQVPWWVVVLGGVAGGAAYAVSEAVQ